MPVIIGAGLAGAAAARFLAESGREVRVLEQKPHPAGAAYDFRHQTGVLVHRYGPHIFHTDSDAAHAFLGRFTEWRPYRHRVLGQIRGKLVPIPFNFDSIDRCFPPEQAAAYRNALQQAYGGGSVGIGELLRSAVPELRELAEFIYENVFLHYTEKQWGMDPRRLGFVTADRVPVRASREDGYFGDRYQAMPVDGYTALVERMLDHPAITVRFGCGAGAVCIDGAELRVEGERTAEPVIHTGCLDALFEYRFGVLPYRSLRFETEIAAWPQQPVAVVNYPNEHAYTRITEFGHFYDPPGRDSVIMREYPLAHDKDGPDEPYYPLPTETGQTLYARYRKAAGEYKNLIPAGRLGGYRYINMDAAVLDGLRAGREAMAIG